MFNLHRVPMKDHYLYELGIELNRFLNPYKYGLRMFEELLSTLIISTIMG